MRAVLIYAKLISIDPLEFKPENIDIKLKGKFLVVPKFRPFIKYEIGKKFVFISNDGGQTYFFLYEASDPQGSNGIDYHWTGRWRKGQIRGKLTKDVKMKITKTEVIEDKEKEETKEMLVDIFDIYEGDFDNVEHKTCIVKKDR